MAFGWFAPLATTARNFVQPVRAAAGSISGERQFGRSSTKTANGTIHASLMTLP